MKPRSNPITVRTKKCYLCGDYTRAGLKYRDSLGEQDVCSACAGKLIRKRGSK